MLFIDNYISASLLVILTIYVVRMIRNFISKQLAETMHRMSTKQTKDTYDRQLKKWWKHRTPTHQVQVVKLLLSQSAMEHSSTLNEKEISRTLWNYLASCLVYPQEYQAYLIIKQKPSEESWLWIRECSFKVWPLSLRSILSWSIATWSKSLWQKYFHCLKKYLLQGWMSSVVLGSNHKSWHIIISSSAPST